MKVFSFLNWKTNEIRLSLYLVSVSHCCLECLLQFTFREDGIQSWQSLREKSLL